MVKGLHHRTVTTMCHRNGSNTEHLHASEDEQDRTCKTKQKGHYGRAYSVIRITRIRLRIPIVLWLGEIFHLGMGRLTRNQGPFLSIIKLCPVCLGA